MSRSSRRGPWLPEEDATLLHLVRTQGPNNWVRISQHMQHRSPKQCRERYHQNLKPSLNHEPISTQEGEMIERLVHEMGKRWAEIARRLGNRSDNAVKNWWNGSMNRRKRNTVQPSGVSRIVGYRTQPIPASAAAAPPPPRYPYADSTLPRDSLQPAYPSPLPFRASDNQLPPLGLSNGLVPLSELGFGDRSQPERLQPQSQAKSDLSSSPWLPSDRPPTTLPVPRSSAFGLPYPGESGCPSSEARSTMRSPDRPEYQLPPLNMMEASAPSPTGTEISQTSSHHQAPSLVSDNQSTCSISPKTVTSPRPGMTVPQGPSVEVWPEIHRRNSTDCARGTHMHGDQKGREEGYPSSASAGWNSSKMELSPALPRPFSLPPPATTFTETRATRREEPCLQTQKTGALTERDTRMNVSRLLD